jgi:hypothetical protein
MEMYYLASHIMFLPEISWKMIGIKSGTLNYLIVFGAGKKTRQNMDYLVNANYALIY